MSVIVVRGVMIDPGHGGSDPGNVNLGLKEKDSTLAIAERVGHYIRLFSHNEQINGPQIKTKFMRVADAAVGIDARAKMARSNACNLMLSIHTDSSLNPLDKGASVYVSKRVEHQAESCALGNAILAGLAPLGFKSRGVMDDTHTHVGSLGVLRETCGAMPAVLVECGFASNPGDRTRLKSAAGREGIAREIASAVVTWFGIKST